MNINTRNLGFVNFNNEEMQWVKFNGVTVYEAWKNLIASGVPPLTLIKSSGKELVDYKIFGNSEQSRLPSEYQQVEYIESTGTQYIDTNFIPNQDTGFDIVFLTKNGLDTTTYGSIMGARENSYKRELQLTTYATNSSGTFRYGSNSYDAGLTVNTKIHITLKNGIYTNNNDLEYKATGTFESPFSLTVFAVNNNNYIIQHGSLQLYSLKLYDGDFLIRDYVPCYRKLDNVIGLYDLVENKFYTNKGTGVFLKGNDTPTPETPIEVESVGEKTKNLFQDTSIIGGSNTTYTNGTITQKVADTSASIQFKLQAYKNLSFLYHIVSKTITNLGVFYLNFTKEDTFNQICFGLNGSTRDTTIIIDVSTLENGKTYTISANMLNITQGAVSWNNTQIEEGSTLTEYEPYGYKIPVKVSGKNLLDSNNLISNGFSLQSDGSYYLKTSSTPYKKILFENIEKIKGSLTLSFYVKYVLERGYIGAFPEIYYTDGTYYSVGSLKEISQDKPTEYVKIEYTTPNNKIIDYITWSYETSGASTYIKEMELKNTGRFNIYLNEPLRKIGDYVDYTNFENKIKSKRIVELILDGTEEWSSINITFEVGYFVLILGSKDYAISDICLSTHYKQTLINSSTTQSGINVINSSTYNDCRLAIRPDLKTYKTIELFKQHLAEQYANGTPVKVYYALSNETSETIELPNILTTKRTCILEVDTKIQPSYMEVIYKGKGKLQVLDTETNEILNDILESDTDTEIDIFDSEINDILDEIIGG